ncbi:uncharacterized protein BX664DRAFT_188996 [Halteromyces radiatus]|uniref:uncharacterized protein n=1 Tax=Halteromyces radiatus TaxID=101107 RepID=UPI00221FD696|nr:uncharacterized protein BX664DRAFT_188996 [Halteromyces radiatus]KAI8083079.1 hypothetical protein BX664DRAFT_188996 [Halteromyces radiatus]
MLSLTKSTKNIDIQLEEEKYYFPGQIIKGVINVHPKHPTKTNNIVLKFTGEFSLSLKEKDTICLFQNTKIINVNSSDEEQTKSIILESKLYTFPFEFLVPNDIQLPSTMDFNKKTRIRYTLSALHDKHMVPESLCPKVDYPVHILEFIDIDDKKYKIPQLKTSHVPLSNINNPSSSSSCIIRVSIPRYGFTRGDIVPLSLVIHHIEPITLSEAIDISLIRTVEIRNNKINQTKEDILKSIKCDIDINGTSSHFSQAMKRQLLVPTSTPPSTQFRDNLLQIQYKVRVNAQLQANNQQKDKKTQQDGTCTIDIPIVIGTYPRASIPIDDDDDNNDNDIYLETDFIDMATNSISSESNLNDSSSIISDDRNAGSTISSLYLSQVEQHHIMESDQIRQLKKYSSESSSGNSSSSTIKLTARPTHGSDIGNGTVGRSDSLASRTSNKSSSSFSSYRSNQSWENSSPSLSRNTSFSTNVSLTDTNKSPVITVNLPSTSETIVMTATPCFDDNINKNISPLPHHRGSDPTGMVLQPVSAQRHSYHDRDQPSGKNSDASFIDHQKRHSITLSSSQSSISENSFSVTNNSSTNITLLAASSASPPVASIITSRHHHSSTSLSSSFHNNEISMKNHPGSRSPTLPLPAMNPTTIMLQPVENNVDKRPSVSSVPQSPMKKAIDVTMPDVLGSRDRIRKDTMDSYQNNRNGNDDDDDDDYDNDDDDDDYDESDLLAIVKKKQEQILLDEQTRLRITEMKI